MQISGILEKKHTHDQNFALQVQTEGLEHWVGIHKAS